MRRSPRSAWRAAEGSAQELTARRAHTVHEGRRFHQAYPCRACDAPGQEVRRGQPGWAPQTARQTDHPAHPTLPLLELFKNADLAEKADAKILYVAVSSDRGLCGGIHSSISKATRKAVAEAPGNVAVLGDKSKAQLARLTPDQMKISFNQIGKDIPTFAEACAIADEIVTKGGEWDQVKIVYNKYVSAISYEASIVTVVNKEALGEAGGSCGRNNPRNWV